MALTAALCWLQGPLGGAHGGAHGGAPLTAGEERRVDITDGNAYTKAEFIAEYGGTLQWDIAKPAKEKVAPTTAAPEAPTTASPGAPTTAAPGAPTTAATGAPTTPTLEVHWRRSRVFAHSSAHHGARLPTGTLASLSRLRPRRRGSVLPARARSARRGALAAGRASGDTISTARPQYCAAAQDMLGGARAWRPFGLAHRRGIVPWRPNDCD